MDKATKTKMQYAGAIALLCECHLYLPNGDSAEELRESIQQAVADFCDVSGWTSQQTLNRIELIPPEPEPGGPEQPEA